MRKSKAIEQRLVALTIKAEALAAQVARLQLDVHTLKTQRELEEAMTDWHIKS
jgi:D-arabinose 5-phosphate isomerase GutQ